MDGSDRNSRLSFPEVGRVRDLASYMDISLNAAYELVASGRIASVRIGKRSIRITREALVEFLQNRSDAIPKLQGEGNRDRG